MSNVKQANGKLNHFVFWPPFLLLLTAVVLNFTSAKSFNRVTNGMNDWVLDHFGWLFLLVGFVCVIVCVAVSFSPLASGLMKGIRIFSSVNAYALFALGPRCLEGRHKPVRLFDKYVLQRRLLNRSAEL